MFRLPATVTGLLCGLFLIASCSDYGLGPDDYSPTWVEDGTDDDCDVELPPAGTVPILEACEGDVVPPMADPWDVVIEWHYSLVPEVGVAVMPAVGNLTDDNGDGVVDEQDQPDIVVPLWGMDRLLALHGNGSGVIFNVPDIYGAAGVTIADVDVDGEPEIVAMTPNYHIVAMAADGTVEWRSSSEFTSQYPQSTVADLDQDGDVEVIFDTRVVRGEDGGAVATLAGVVATCRTPVATDLDADGTLEIILGENVYSHTGALEWSSTTTGAANFAAVADIDGDDRGEVFFVTGNQLLIHDHDGTPIHSVYIPGDSPGPPAMADFDGDGQVEIAIPANHWLSLFETDGSVRWEVPISDDSGLAGCSGYDVDGDGAYEVLYADEERFQIYDGNQGTLLYENPSHDSNTLWEYPVIADVDGDGSAEIVIASNRLSGSPWAGITVFGHAGNGWARSGPTWGLHDFAVTNLNPDGSVPSPTPPPWTKHNVFRARPTVDKLPRPDLVPRIHQVCVISCDPGPAQVSYGVDNQGAVDVAAGAPISLYGLDGGTETLVETQTLPAVPAGASVPGGVFEFHPDLWGDGILLRVNDGVPAEGQCVVSNNDLVLIDSICGG